MRENVIAANQSAAAGGQLQAPARAGARADEADRSWKRIVAEFESLAARLDAAGLGPADYLYAPLKLRLQHPANEQSSYLTSVVKVCRLILTPPPTPRRLGHAAILAASSYSVSAKFLRSVVESFEPGEAILCDVSDHSRSASRKVLDSLRALAGLCPALIFAIRVNSLLKAAGTGSAERRLIAEAGLVHATYRRAACAVLSETKPECLVLGNGNRPFEFALFAEARRMGFATVLLPYAEINPKPARFFSLCRGAFDLALPFSDHSAAEICKLREEAAIAVVGFPRASVRSEVRSKPDGKAFTALYISGNNFEQEASAILRDAFADSKRRCLRVRLHPRNSEAEMRGLFSWISPDQISYPLKTPLADDIGSADVAIMVRSTVALDAMFAGVPVIWLSPKEHLPEIEGHPIRKQGLALLEASKPDQLRAIVENLGDAKERKRIADEQLRRLKAAGYTQGYFEAVKSALRRLVDELRSGKHPKTAAVAAAVTKT